MMIRFGPTLAQVMVMSDGNKPLSEPVKFCGIHLRAISQEMVKISGKITQLKSPPYFSWGNELIH